MLLRALIGVEVSDPEHPEQPAEKTLDAVARVDHVGRSDRGQSERDDDDSQHVGSDLWRLTGQSERGDHDRELAHLRQVDRGQQAGPESKSKGVENWHYAETADDHKRGRRERDEDDMSAR